MAQTPVFLFLDFDGVLHPMGARRGECDFFCCVEAFEDALRESGRAVQIVISSAWRYQHTLEQLRVPFSKDIAKMIIGMTPVLDNGLEPGQRLVEVQRWLRKHRKSEAAWVAIDDMPELYGAGTVVVCHDQFGEREHGLLVQALRDPQAFGLAHPCPLEAAAYLD